MMKIVFASTFVILIAFSLNSFAGGTYTCRTETSTGTETIYVADDFSSMSSVPYYRDVTFRHSTPTDIMSGFSRADVFFWVPDESAKSVNVIAVLETTSIKDGAFEGRLTITEGRGKPYARILKLSCAR
jgi:hypothetical protein